MYITNESTKNNKSKHPFKKRAVTLFDLKSGESGIVVRVDGAIVECNFHSGAFNIRTGAVASPPCLVPIRTYYTEVQDGHVFIDPDRPAEP